MGLPKYGIQAVVEGLPAFNKAMDTINKKIETLTQPRKTDGKISALGKDSETAAKGVDKLRDKLNQFIQQNVPFGNVLSGILDKLTAIPLPALAATAAVVGLGAAFIELGKRGASLIGLAQTFDNVTSSVGVSSQQLLKDLRTASAGTISDFGLIEKANVALSGATGKLGEALGQKLPRLLEIARVQARATGKDIDFIFTSLVEGVRKSSPLRIDNAQLIIKVTAAEEAYAKSIGKTVEQLTVEEKGIAILNATLEAGNAALAQAGNVQETNAEKIARAQATITNTLDGLAVAVQPAFGVVLDAVQKVLNIFQQLGNAIGPIFGNILSIVAGVFSTIVDVVTAIVQPIIDAFSSIAPYIAAVFQLVANIVSGVGKVIGDVVGGIVTFLKDVAKNFFGLDLENLGPRLFNGAAAAFGSFANGIISVANQLIFPAVIGIAKFIADFLIGFSPPKKGPLSKIDQGGENLMMAWLDGIAGVSLDPVEQVAQEVSDALGGIGKQSLKSVNARLAQLDKALLPFQNRLDIVKANFEALAEPARAALDAIDRQEAELQAALAKGDPEAAERLRLLDQQRDAIQGQLDAQQSIVDRATLQLALAKAQQAPERALLTIRQKYLEALLKAQPKVKSGGQTGGGGDTTPKGSGAGAIAPEIPGAAAPMPGGEMPSVLDLIGGQGAVDEAIQGMQDAFMGQIDTSNLDAFVQNSLDLGTQIDRIKSVDIGSKLADKFKGLTDAFNPDVDGSPANVIRNFVQTLTGDENTPGSVASFFANLPENVSKAASGLWDLLKVTVFDPVTNFLTGEGEGTLSGALLAGVEFFVGFPQSVVDAASGLWDALKTNVFDPVVHFLTGTDEGTMSAVIAQFIQLFANLPSGIVDALKGMAAAVYNAVVVPIINVLNAGIGAVEAGVRNIASFFAGLLGDIIGGFDRTEVAGTNLGGLVPQALRDFQANLASIGSGFTIGRISSALPSFLQPTGAETGGLFGPGLLRIGERGEEMVYNASKVGVIPNALTQVISDIGSILAQPQPMPLYAGNSYDHSSSMTNNFYGVQGSNDVMRRMAQLQARR